MNLRSTNSICNCFHCGLPVGTGVSYHALLSGVERDFCCLGCQSVCTAIFEAGLQGYYQRTPEGILLGPPPEPPKDIDIYDLDEVQQEVYTAPPVCG
jgi:Cu2+-exporting ATPase